MINPEVSEGLETKPFHFRLQQMQTLAFIEKKYNFLITFD